MADFTQTLQELPASGLIPIVLIVVLGIFLWAAGKRILRGGFAALGLIIGGMLGWLVGDMLNLGAGAWIAAVVGALVLACIAALAFRFAIAAVMAVILGIAAPLCALTVAEVQAARAGRSLHDGEVHNLATDKIVEWWEKPGVADAREQISDQIKSMSDALSSTAESAKTAPVLPEEAKVHIEEIRRFSQRMIDAIEEKWSQTPESLRPTLIVSAVCGGILGLILGAIASSLSAVVITALGGSLLWLSGLQILALRLSVPDGPWMPATGTSWLIVWLITSAIGFGIQWTFRKRRADKAA